MLVSVLDWHNCNIKLHLTSSSHRGTWMNGKRHYFVNIINLMRSLHTASMASCVCNFFLTYWASQHFSWCIGHFVFIFPPQACGGRCLFNFCFACRRSNFTDSQFTILLIVGFAQICSILGRTLLFIVMKLEYVVWFVKVILILTACNSFNIFAKLSVWVCV